MSSSGRCLGLASDQPQTIIWPSLPPVAIARCPSISSFPTPWPIAGNCRFVLCWRGRRGTAVLLTAALLHYPLSHATLPALPLQRDCRGCDRGRRRHRDGAHAPLPVLPWHVSPRAVQASYSLLFFSRPLIIVAQALTDIEPDWKNVGCAPRPGATLQVPFLARSVLTLFILSLSLSIHRTRSSRQASL